MIWLVNSKPAACGIYEFGFNLGKTLKFYNENIVYKEIDNHHEFIFHLHNYPAPKVILFNYHPGTLPWIDQYWRFANSKPALILHERMENWGWPVIIPDPTKQDSEGVFYTGRIVNDYYFDSVYDTPIVGSYGLSFHHKGFDKVIDLAGKTYPDGVLVRIVAPKATFGSWQETNEVYEKCLETASKYKNLTLSYTGEFIEKDKLLDFLCFNDVNVFAYNDRDTLAVSSAVDLALEVRKPIAVSNSRLFRHLPDQCRYEKYGLKEIVDNGIKHLEPLYERWSPRHIYDRYMQICAKIICS